MSRTYAEFFGATICVTVSYRVARQEHGTTQGSPAAVLLPVRLPPAAGGEQQIGAHALPP